MKLDDTLLIQNNNLKTRKPGVALILSLLFPGLGQIYNGQIGKALIFLILMLFVPIILAFVFVILSFPLNLIIPLILFLVLLIYIVGDAYVNARRLGEGYQLKFCNKWYFYLIYVILVLFVGSGDFVEKNICAIYSIPSKAMKPTLLPGDQIIVNMLIYEIRIPFIKPQQTPNRGDVIIFKYPVDESKDNIRRVVGIEGDLVEIRDKQVYLNGEPWDDPFGVHRDPNIFSRSDLPRDNFGPVTIPEDSLFVMGDNRDGSLDSRFWGFVGLEKVKGRAKNIYFSWDEEKERVRWERIGRDIK